jgi:ABC-2 type transport system ATP-binding protein
MISIEGLTKKYGQLTAVDGLTLRVRPGEIYGFLGPNGAGKTTTIKIITGLLRPTSGRVMVAGHDAELDPAAARAVTGYISDEPHPYERLTGREFLLTMASLYGVNGTERERRVTAGLGLFGLDRWADELTESYSHGMKQKLMVAAALLHDPQAIVADEPLVGLDPASAHRLREHFRVLAKKGRTILLATHILEIAERMCDRVGIIMGGRLIAEGSMAELKAGSGAASLEDVFLALTAPDGPAGEP